MARGGQSFVKEDRYYLSGSSSELATGTDEHSHDVTDMSYDPAEGTDLSYNATDTDGTGTVGTDGTYGTYGTETDATGTTTTYSSPSLLDSTQMTVSDTEGDSSLLEGTDYSYTDKSASSIAEVPSSSFEKEESRYVFFVSCFGRTCCGLPETNCSIEPPCKEDKSKMPSLLSETKGKRQTTETINPEGQASGGGLWARFQKRNKNQETPKIALSVFADYKEDLRPPMASAKAYREANKSFRFPKSQKQRRRRKPKAEKEEIKRSKKGDKVVDKNSDKKREKNESHKKKKRREHSGKKHRSHRKTKSEESKSEGLDTEKVLDKSDENRMKNMTEQNKTTDSEHHESDGNSQTDTDINARGSFHSDDASRTDRSCARGGNDEEIRDGLDNGSGSNTNGSMTEGSVHDSQGSKMDGSIDSRSRSKTDGSFHSDKGSRTDGSIHSSSSGNRTDGSTHSSGESRTDNSAQSSGGISIEQITQTMHPIMKTESVETGAETVCAGNARIKTLSSARIAELSRKTLDSADYKRSARSNRRKHGSRNRLQKTVE